MKARFSIVRPLLRLVCVMVIGCAFGLIVPPYAGGLYYSLCGGHEYEQEYLNQCIAHLRLMRACCDDPDLQGILDYTIQHYNRVGPWDVMIFPLSGIVRPGCKVVGCNSPLCPGITLDPCLLLEAPEDTAIVIAHEALHNYWPYVGHDHINAREQKLYKLSYRVRGCR